MKIIDLLNKIANGEEVPSKIHYGFDDYKLINYGGKTKFYQCLTEPYTVFNVKTDCLNDEVEILEEEPYVEVCGNWFTKSEYDKLFLEEEKKIPEKIPEEIIVGKKQPVHRIKKIEKKINEIIDYLDYLKSKGE